MMEFFQIFKKLLTWFTRKPLVISPSNPPQEILQNAPPVIQDLSPQEILQNAPPVTQDLCLVTQDLSPQEEEEEVVETPFSFQRDMNELSGDADDRRNAYAISQGQLNQKGIFKFFKSNGEHIDSVSSEAYQAHAETCRVISQSVYRGAANSININTVLIPPVNNVDDAYTYYQYFENLQWKAWGEFIKKDKEEVSIYQIAKVIDKQYRTAAALQGNSNYKFSDRINEWKKDLNMDLVIKNYKLPMEKLSQESGYPLRFVGLDTIILPPMPDLNRRHLRSNYVRAVIDRTEMRCRDIQLAAQGKSDDQLRQFLFEKAKHFHYIDTSEKILAYRNGTQKFIKSDWFTALEIMDWRRFMELVFFTPNVEHWRDLGQELAPSIENLRLRALNLELELENVPVVVHPALNEVVSAPSELENVPVVYSHVVDPTVAEPLPGLSAWTVLGIIAVGALFLCYPNSTAGQVAGAVIECIKKSDD